MEFRHLGRSGHARQRDLVRQLDHPRLAGRGGRRRSPASGPPSTLGITTFDTADVYAGTRAEAVLGRALAGRAPRRAWRSSPRSTGPPAPGRNDRGLSRKHIMESINGSLRRLQTDYVDLYQAHRYDYATPLEETMEAFADVVHAGKAHYIGVSEWTADADPGRARAGPGAADPARLQPAAVLDAVAGHRGRGGPDLRGAGPRPDRLVADRAGRADRQVPAGPAAAGGLPGHRRQVGRGLHQPAHDATTC